MAMIMLKMEILILKTIKTKKMSSFILLIFQVRIKLLSKLPSTQKNKTIGDGGITVDFWIIKVHASKPKLEKLKFHKGILA